MLTSDRVGKYNPGGLSQAYRKIWLTRVFTLSGLLLALVATFVIDVLHGPTSLGLSALIDSLFNPARLTAAERVILLDVRLPYALMAMVVGGALGLAGAEMQTALNNPLASPFTLGIGAAATLGASLVIVFNVTLYGIDQTFFLPVSAWLMASFSALIILSASRILDTSIQSVLLFGIALMFGFNALVGMIQFVAEASALQQIVFWTMGSLARADMTKVAIVAAVLAICLTLSLRQASQLTSMRSGEEQAASQGINVGRLRLIVLLRVSLLTAAALAFVGEIGFIGLVGPHIARLLLGEDHRFFLPGSVLTGAVLMSLASVASKAVIPGIILPVGIVTALIGIPLFLILIIRQSKRGLL